MSRVALVYLSGEEGKGVKFQFEILMTLNDIILFNEQAGFLARKTRRDSIKTFSKIHKPERMKRFLVYFFSLWLLFTFTRWN
jgi:hypothetical protein